MNYNDNDNQFDKFMDDLLLNNTKKTFKVENDTPQRRYNNKYYRNSGIDKITYKR